MKTSQNKLLNIFINIYNKNRNNKLFSLLLYISSLVFFLLYKTRLFLYKIKILKTTTLPAYIISIGNITSGGTGKTPISIETAKYFMSLGHKVAILTRGYNTNQEDKVTLVNDGTELLTDYENCGDEAYMIAKNLPNALVISGKDRIRSAKAAIKLGAGVIILDDGFQYIKLNRNENILMIDSYNPFDKNRLIPLGKSRECPDSISRATSIILSNSDRTHISEKDLNTIKKYAKQIPVGKISYKIKELISLNTKRVLNISSAKGLEAIACCGIGNPQSFIDLLKRNEIKITDYIIYPDHYNYQFEDIEKMIKVCKEYNTENIIISEKDAVKITDLCQAAPISFWSTKIEVLWENSTFFDTIFEKKETIKTVVKHT